MGQKFSLLVLIFLCAGALAAQIAAPEQGAPSSLPAALQKAIQAPTDADVYCAGFFTRQPVDPGLAVLGSPDGSLNFEFADRSIIYLNKGKGPLSAPGGQYMLVRPVQDIVKTEAFPGQRLILARLGTLYAEIARIQVRILHEGSATAEILHACQPVEEGDIAIPLAPHAAPPYKSAKFPERFAPASGKATGVIAAVKEFQNAAGAGHVVYLDLGKKQGAQVGGYVRIFRSYQSPSQDLLNQGTRNYLTDMMGVPMGRKLTPEEIKSLPRTVVGEMMILSAEEESSTALVTYTWQEIYPGDQAEIE